MQEWVDLGWSCLANDQRSREDAYYGDQVSFSPHAFAQTLLYMPNDTINLQQSANARLSRVMTTNATNPEWSQREGRVQQLSFGESLLYITVLGNPQKYELRKDYFRYFFGKWPRISRGRLQKLRRNRARTPAICIGLEKKDGAHRKKNLHRRNSDDEEYDWQHISLAKF